VSVTISSVGSLGLELSKELVFLLDGLETSVSDLGGRVDEFDLDLFGLPGFGEREDRLSEGDWSLASSSNTSLDEDEVFVDDTVVGESTKRSDVLLDSIGGGGSIVGDSVDGTSSNSVDLFVELGTRVIAKLTATGDSPLDGGWMPGANTGNLSQTSVRLAVQTGHAESLNHTGHSLSASDTDHINALRVLKDFGNLDLLLELGLSEGDLVSDRSTVKLDFHNVGLVLSEAELADLGGADNTHNSGVLLNASNISLNGSLGLVVFLVAVGVLGEGLLLGVHPVLVETSLHVLVQLLGPDG